MEMDKIKGLFWGIVACAIISLIFGCRSVERLPAETVKTDSVRVETRYVKYTEKDTVYLEIPAQTAERTTEDSTSHLENDYAVSDARINADGTLYHDLRTKPQKKPVPTEKQVERKDSIVYRNKEVEVPVYIEKDLGWWEKVCIRWFPYSIVAVALLSFVIVWFVKKKRNK